MATRLTSPATSKTCVLCQMCLPAATEAAGKATPSVVTNSWALKRRMWSMELILVSCEERTKNRVHRHRAWINGTYEPDDHPIRCW